MCINVLDSFAAFLTGILQPGVVPRALTPQSPRSPAWSNKSGSERFGDGEEFETRKDVKTLFVQCFKDDLIQERQLLMSQINNLFKLRNNGEPLQYKEAGYEKLHNFLTDIPGLCLVGAGNRMEPLLNVAAQRFPFLCSITTFSCFDPRS